MAAWTFQELATLRLWRSFSQKKKVLVEFWTPKDTLLDRAKTDRVPYDAWERGGHIHTTPGKAVKYGFVAERIADLSMLFDIRRSPSTSTASNILNRNWKTLLYQYRLFLTGRGYYKAQDSGLWMPHSIELFEQMLDDGVLIIKTNPCLRWNAASAVTEADQKENPHIRQEKEYWSNRWCGCVSDGNWCCGRLRA